MPSIPKLPVSKIGTIEKRELAKLMENQFNEVIQTTQQEMQFTEGEILVQAEKKFGIACIEKQVKQLREQIAMLEKKRTQLGFINNYNGTTSGFTKTWAKHSSMQEVDKNTPAGRFFYLKMARNLDIQAIKDQRDNKLKRLWLSDDRKEVETIVNEKPKLLLVKK